MLAKELKITSFDVDATSQVKISSLMKYFQQIAREDLESFGMTYDFLRENNIIFVLTKYKLVVHSQILSEQNVKLITSPCEIKGVSFIRDFVIEDQSGKRLAEASSSWVIINYATRRILRPNQLPKPVAADEKLVPFFPDKTIVRGEKSFDYVVKVTNSLLDQNNHLNNCNYADIIFDGLYENNHKISQVVDIDINFDHEALLCDRLSVEYYFNDNEIMVKCINTSQDKVCFTAVLK